MVRIAIISVYLLFNALGATQLYANEMKEGLKAYHANDYLTASRIFKYFAKQGIPEAQRYLGELYDKGQGVPQNYHKALNWYLRAASQNDAYAQYRLGIKYANGHGVELDNKRAYAWFAMAFDNGFLRAADPLMVLNKTMNTEDKQLALKLATEQIKQLKH